MSHHVDPIQPSGRPQLRASADQRRRRQLDRLSRRQRLRLARQAARPDRPAVLVVDDDFDARNIFAAYLRSKGCLVFTGIDGRAALEKAANLWPDLIVMDLAMPRVDGWEAIRQLRQSSWTRAIPIIAVSAVPVSRYTALEAGCDAYLEKPCDPQTLWLQVRALLGISDAGTLLE